MSYSSHVFCSQRSFPQANIIKCMIITFLNVSEPDFCSVQPVPRHQKTLSGSWQVRVSHWSTQWREKATQRTVHVSLKIALPLKTLVNYFRYMLEPYNYILLRNPTVLKQLFHIFFKISHIICVWNWWNCTDRNHSVVNWLQTMHFYVILITSHHHDDNHIMAVSENIQTHQ